MYIDPSSYYYYLKGRRIISGLGDSLFSRSKATKRAAYLKASLVEYLNLNSYLSLSYQADSLSSVYTGIELLSDTLGHDRKDIILRYGTPDFIFTNNKLTIFVYNRALNKLKIRYEIHFYAGRVFLLNQIYRQIETEDKNYLIQSTLAKYLIKDARNSNRKVIDIFDNVMVISDYLMGLRISFWSNKKSGWFDGMKSEVD